MADLRPCPSCDRHVRDEERCPFCDAELPTAAPRRTPVGRFARAAVFAGALAGSSVACGGQQKPDDTNNNGDGSGDLSNSGGDDTTTTTADAGAVVDQPDDPPPPPPDDYEPMPYGAPPARQRLV